MIRTGRTLSSRWLGSVFGIERCSFHTRPPLFLCPALRQAPLQRVQQILPRKLHVQAAAQTQAAEVEQLETVKQPIKQLPAQCTGCGAPSQTTIPGQPGYFDVNRRAVAEYLGIAAPRSQPPRKIDKAVENALLGLDLDELERQGVDLKTLVRDDPGPASDPDLAAVANTNPPPICERCHNLVHHGTGSPIFHPSVESLRETILESPYKYNHVYHVLDAADFPMSLLPRIAQLMEAMPLRSHNRRSRNAKYYANKKTEVSFIITRADLLGATKEDVDHLLPYLRETLRDALGRNGDRVRLGNLKCVSAKRGWWTQSLKEDIYQRGGGGWLVGKANVGKSNLFSAVFPKGRMVDKPPKHDISVDLFPAPDAPDKQTPAYMEDYVDEMNDYSLLPPVQPETPYPAMPLVSPLPGTTASPIRLAFGGGKGELIDLPGLPRSDLETHVQEEHRGSLVMRNRLRPAQQVLAPGKSLLLGGFIRITPRTPDVVFLAYNFTPLKEHVTSTAKAIGVQERTDPVNVENIALPEASENIKLAGSYQLHHDVTKKRTGPLTSKSGLDLPLEKLPFRVLAVDILIEGCGWVEIVAQVSKRRFPVSTPSPTLPGPKAQSARPSRVPEKNGEQHELLQSLDLSDPDALEAEKFLQSDSSESWPVVDVFTPEGRYVSSRRPLNAWLINKPKASASGNRPRRSMRFAKKRDKEARRRSSQMEG